MVARFLIPALLLPVMMAAAPFDRPAHAATALTFGPAALTEGWFEFTGLDGVAGSESLAARLSLTLVESGSKSFTFAYTVANRTGGAFTRARLFGFGFDVDASLSGRSATGDFSRISSGNVPGFGPIDVCLLAGGNGKNCAQAGKQGLLIGDGTASGRFTLHLPSAVTDLTLDNSFVRWEALNAPDLDLKGGGGAATAGLALDMLPLPEPSTWVMMIAGFGLVGSAARRARSGGIRETAAR
jgi:hypothetical protein